MAKKSLPLPEVVTILIITPEIARRLLGYNSANRNIRSGHMQGLASAMSGGEWGLSPDAITMTGPSLEDPKRILNGQHRLLACIESDTPFRAICYFNAKESVFDICDKGSKRTLADLLRSRGTQNATVVAAMVSAAFFYIRGRQARSSLSMNSGLISTEKALEFVEHWPQLAEVASRWTSIRHVCSNASAALTGVFLARITDPILAEKFADGLTTGENLSKGSPMLAWIKRMRETKEGTSREPPAITLALTIKAFKALQEGREVTVLKWDQREDFPTLSGCPLNPN